MATDARVTTRGIEGDRPDREAHVRPEQPMVPKATFESYYGRPVLKEPTWKAPDIPGYFFCGGLAGTASVLAAGADLTGRPELARAAKVGAIASMSIGMAGLLHDLGRPARFLNMLRVCKPTSPMSLGSWLISAYTPAAAVAALSATTRRLRPLGAIATASAAVLGPAVASYTGALVSDTAIPAWHDAYREMPYLFVSSGLVASSGLALAATPVAQAGPARRAALLATAGDLVMSRSIEQRLGANAGPYKHGKGGAYMRAARMFGVGGALVGATFGARNRAAAAVSGGALIAASFCTKMGVFEAGRASARDPEQTVRPQRERLLS